MPREQLRETLALLSDQLERSDDLDADAVDEIREAIGEIREALDDDESELPFDAVRQRLNDAASDFERTHPTLASHLGRVCDLLSRIGV